MRKLKSARGVRRRARERGQSIRNRLTILGVAAVAALAGTAALAPSAAQAQYYGGCTYSWGTPCYIVYGGPSSQINFLITQDSEHAANTWGALKPNNGYALPVRDNRTRDLCGTIMYKPGTLSPYGWTCNWGTTSTTYPNTVGYSAIGGAEYYGIKVYQMINYTEGGPCGQQGSEC